MKLLAALVTVVAASVAAAFLAIGLCVMFAAAAATLVWAFELGWWL